ncbi:MAG: murein biosynthesis integral membrane protein MurJ [bacterium]|nr:murein biosynthesis integral membrane protein MurJ [bacterium]
MRQALSRSARTVTSAAFLVAFFSILSRIVGLIRDRILAGEFGASDELDIYFAAFRLPDLFYALIVVGALSASFIPLFTKEYAKHKQKAWDLTSNTLTILTVIFSGLLVVVAIMAPVFVDVIAPGFDVEKQLAVIELLRLMLVAQLILGASMVIGSALQGAKVFLPYAIAPIFYNLGIILGSIFLVPIFGLNGLAFGVIGGAFFHLMIQLIGLYAVGYRYRLLFRFRDASLRYIAGHLPPRVMGLAIGQVNLLAMTAIASTLTVGAVTMLQFAYNIFFFPLGVIGVSYAIAAFPSLCEKAGKRDTADFRDILSLTMRQMLLFMVPATILFYGLRMQIVRVAVGAGAYDWAETIQTANVMGWLVMGLIAHGLIFLLVRAFFAKNDSMTPFIVGLMSTTIFIASALLLTPHYQIQGIAIAYSGSAVLQAIALFALLSSRIKADGFSDVLNALIKFSIAGIVTAGSLQGFKTIATETLGFTLNTFWGVFGQGLFAGSLAFIVYIALLYVLRAEELLSILVGLERRVRKKAKPEEAILSGVDA